mmetsp:Transcript_33115/g.105548  ORF Transcript_33115/g.105548 Transcript_33115/m.105548 type:complete len:404 (+) Transcript_33115:73-1284(+)
MTTWTHQVWKDERRIEVLLSEHRSKVEAVKADVGSLGPEYDDIFVLRFILSHPDVPEAASALKKTLAWRKEKAALLQRARDGTLPEKGDVITKYMFADLHKTTKYGEPIYLVRAGVSNIAAAMDLVEEHVMVDYMLYRKEQSFIQADKTTRETGLLTKIITVNDLNHVSLMAGQDARFRAVMSKSAKLSEDFYPQLVEKAVLTNLPTFINLLLGVFKAIMPKRLLEKLSVCPGRTVGGDISQCPFLRERMRPEDLPTFLGGACKCEAKGGCILGVPNVQSNPNPKVGEDGLATHTIAARSKHEVCVPAPAPGSSVHVVFEVLGTKSIEFGMVLRGEGGEGAEVTMSPARKYRPEDGVVELTLKAPGTGGVVVCTWDNSASVVNSKSIKYAATTVPPAGESEGH